MRVWSRQSCSTRNYEVVKLWTELYTKEIELLRNRARRARRDDLEPHNQQANKRQYTYRRPVMAITSGICISFRSQEIMLGEHDLDTDCT